MCASNFPKKGKEIYDNSMKFKLNNTIIPNSKSTKFLGITFNSNMNFNEHINNIKDKCNKRLQNTIRQQIEN